MALSIFGDKAYKPKEEDVSVVLGDTKPLWDQIKVYISNEHGAVVEEWKNYGKASGWTLLLKNKKRTVLYLFPTTGSFIVQFVYGEKAVEKVMQCALPKEIIESIREAKPYVEGRSFRVNVKCASDLEHIKELIDIKVST